MIVYQLTEDQYRALLNDLELAKFQTPSGMTSDPAQREAERRAVEDIHRRFHYCVVSALGGIRR